jgi:hypothetical protein
LPIATTADDVWRLLGELVAAQKETDRRFQETERFLQEQSQETDRRFQETECLLGEQSQATHRLLKEQSQRVDEQLGKLGNRLGEFVEWQVPPAAVKLFQARGVDVHELYPGVSVQRPQGSMEIDLLVLNETEAVVIEVKSKLNQADVDDHLKRLGQFKQLMPRYLDVRALGAVAGMVVPEEVARYAYRKRLFVLAQSGDSVVILNDDQFQPRTW